MASNEQNPVGRPARSPARFQYSLATLLSVMVLATVLLAFFGGVLREAEQIGSAAFLVFLLLLTAAPIGLLIVGRGLRQLRQRWRVPERRQD